VLNELGLAFWKNIVEAAPDATLEPVFVSVPEERVRELVNTPAAISRPSFAN
jgi:hypothetical protein